MSRWIRPIPPLGARLAAGRPVLAQQQVTELAKQVMDMTTGNAVTIRVSHTARVVTRLANDEILASDDGDELTIIVQSAFGGDLQGVRVTTNQLNESVLRAMVQRCETLAREHIEPDEHVLHQPQEQDTFVPVQLWHDATIQAMATTRKTVIPELLGTVAQKQLHAAGFLGLMARSEALITKEGIFAYSEETDSEVTVTARGPDGRTSGWGGAAARDWSKVQYVDAAKRAVETALLSANPVALEPGRRTAILSSAAVVQIVRYLAEQFSAAGSDLGFTAFSKAPTGNKIGQRVFDPRINMRSDPAEPEGGYRPYFSQGHATPAMSWIENGVLKNLAYDPAYAMGRGKVYSELPYSLHISGGTTSVDQMIAQCKEGIFVNRVSSVEEMDRRSGLVTGVTRDGCYLVKNGKIERALKNFRFLDSPFFFLNNIEALGPTGRAAFGYTPPGHREGLGPTDWPRRPIIAPPMMVRDFNFNALADAV